MPRNLDSSRSPSLNWSVLLVYCERREQHICLENYSKLAPRGWQKELVPLPQGNLIRLGGGDERGKGRGGFPCMLISSQMMSAQFQPGKSSKYILQRSENAPTDPVKILQTVRCKLQQTTVKRWIQLMQVINIIKSRSGLYSHQLLT